MHHGRLRSSTDPTDRARAPTGQRPGFPLVGAYPSPAFSGAAPGGSCRGVTHGALTSSRSIPVCPVMRVRWKPFVAMTNPPLLAPAAPRDNAERPSSAARETVNAAIVSFAVDYGNFIDSVRRRSVWRRSHVMWSRSWPPSRTRLSKPSPGRRRLIVSAGVEQP